MIGKTLGHYEILDQLGAGGMGVVYRAHDDQLDRQVALKVLPPGALSDESARRQFRKEALALAKLNHPNIETVYEFGTQDGVDFLAMELITGQPLNEKLKGGSVSERELMRFGVQLAEGLAAAHEAGVINSDLKPGNIFITPDNRLKILDFGLARLLKGAEETDVTQSITADRGAMAGTLPYMSPEQLRGESTDARSDIYAAGTVLYEMATGTRPFPQNQPAQLIGAILHTEPAPPRSINDDVPPGIEAVILKALDKSPPARYQTARELRTALETLTTTAFLSSRPAAPAGARASSATTGHGDTESTTARWRSKQFTAGAAAAVLVVAAGGLLLGFDVGGLRSRMFRRAAAESDAHSTDPTNTSVPTRRSVAVLPLVNLSKKPEQAWLSTELQEMLSTEIGAGGNIRSISSEAAARMQSDLALPESASYTRETLQRIQKILDADDVVTGSYIAPGNGDLRLDLRLQDARTGETIASVPATGKMSQVSDLLDTVTRAGVELREKLGVEGRVPEADASLKASVAANSSAAQLYAEGLDKLNHFDALGAKELLEKAVKQDGNYALAHSALAEAWATLGYDDRAEKEESIALPLSSSLSREEQGMIQGRLDEFSSRWNDAATMYLSLRMLYPGNLDYGLRQASAQVRGGNPKAALDTVSELRGSAGPSGEDPRIDLAQADAEEMLGDFKEQEAVASRAAAKATQRGMTRVLADAEWHRCTALVNLGNTAEAKTECEKARGDAKTAEDPLLEARSLTGLGNALENEGNIAQSLDCHKQALQLVRKIGAQRDIAGALLNVANLTYAQGDLKGATGYYRDSLATSRLINNKQGVVDAEDGLAADLYASGDYYAAQPIYEDMLRTAREIGDQKNAALALNSLGLVLFQQGEVESARKHLKDSLDDAHKANMNAYYASWLCSLADVELAQDHLDAAEKDYQESLRLNQQLGSAPGLAQANSALANLAVERKEPQKAEQLARQAVEAFHNQKNADSETDALNTLIRALIQESNLAEAHKVLDQSRGLTTQDQSIRSALATTAALLQGLEGATPQALQALNTICDKAKQTKWKKQELEVRLAKAAVEMQAGQKSSALAELRTLERDSRAAGFQLIARKAAALAKPNAGSSS